MKQPARAYAGIEPCGVVVAGDRCINEDNVLGGAANSQVRPRSVRVAIAASVWVALSSVWVASGQSPSPASTEVTVEPASHIAMKDDRFIKW